MRHTIEDGAKAWGTERPKKEEAWDTKGYKGSSMWKTPRVLPLSHCHKRDSVLAYIFTRKCPLPLLPL